MDCHKKRLAEFDLLNSPLQGVNLIEASAGTGKTFAITGLFLRLLLEKRLALKDILVVTYTLAATEELRDRIRKKIREALEAFVQGDSADPFLKALLQQTDDKEEALAVLRRALCDFDQAAIFTIHGFCQRTLQESAFESGALFDTELKPDQESGLLEEIVQDFWRLHFYQAPREWVRYALKAKYRPAVFLDLLRNRVPPQDLKILPEFPEDTTQEAFPLRPFQEAFNKLRQSWPEVQEDVKERLNDPALFAEYGKNLFDLLDLMNTLVREEVSPFPLPKGFEKFTTEVLEKKTKKGKSTPRHPFFPLCDELKETADNLRTAMDRQFLYLKVELFKILKKELPERKQRQNIQSFDDLLTRLEEALEKSGGEKLSRAIRLRYQAALIDEFQDTDPVQYAIFRNVFGRDEAILFLIGDPKQAIYSFRGADLFAYLKAASRVDARYTLTKNWRSEPGLIEAVNTLFSGSSSPFL
ncbi:MAG TPA: UvrD-helicase domain-containing protein, partial [Thermodesulfobacteriota bacterium]|nr:UvrD-helicase domain-containing protein [Thermodesulfobacteriota bacterium]